MKSLHDECLGAFYELLRNPTITVYTMKDGVEQRRAATDGPISFSSLGVEIGGFARSIHG